MIRSSRGGAPASGHRGFSHPAARSAAAAVEPQVAPEQALERGSRAGPLDGLRVRRWAKDDGPAWLGYVHRPRSQGSADTVSLWPIECAPVGRLVAKHGRMLFEFPVYFAGALSRALEASDWQSAT
jgi:hypothetical protein